MTERLAKAQGPTVLNAEDELAWKKHFASQLTMIERGKIAVHKEPKLLNRTRTGADSTKILQIKNYLPCIPVSGHFLRWFKPQGVQNGQN
jgi:hypothetical protein